MSSLEKQLGIIRDLLMPADAKRRYDIYITDRRIAIVCMGKAKHLEAESFEPISAMPSAFGVPPPAETLVEKIPDMRQVEEEIKNWQLDDILRLSKKSGYYTYDEIEEVKLILGHRPKFEILSEECESKFSPNPQQMETLLDLLPSIEALKNKLAVAGNWKVLQEIFRAHTKT